MFQHRIILKILEETYINPKKTNGAYRTAYLYPDKLCGTKRTRQSLHPSFIPSSQNVSKYTFSKTPYEVVYDTMKQLTMHILLLSFNKGMNRCTFTEEESKNTFSEKLEAKKEIIYQKPQWTCSSDSQKQIYSSLFKKRTKRLRNYDGVALVQSYKSTNRRDTCYLQISAEFTSL